MTLYPLVLYVRARDLDACAARVDAAVRAFGGAIVDARTYAIDYDPTTNEPSDATAVLRARSGRWYRATVKVQG